MLSAEWVIAWRSPPTSPPTDPMLVIVNGAPNAASSTVAVALRSDADEPGALARPGVLVDGAAHPKAASPAAAAADVPMKRRRVTRRRKSLLMPAVPFVSGYQTTVGTMVAFSQGLWRAGNAVAERHAKRGSGAESQLYGLSGRASREHAAAA